MCLHMDLFYSNGMVTKPAFQSWKLIPVVLRNVIIVMIFSLLFPLFLFQEFLLFTFGCLWLILSFSFYSYISVKLSTKLCPYGFFQSWKIWKHSAQTSFCLWVFQTLFPLHDPDTFRACCWRICSHVGRSLALPFMAHHQVSQHSGKDSGPRNHSQDKEMQLRHMNSHHIQNNETPIQFLLPWMPHIPLGHH